MCPQPVPRGRDTEGHPAKAQKGSRISRATPQGYSHLAVPRMWGLGCSGPLPALSPIKLSSFRCLLLLSGACKTFPVGLDTAKM